MTYSKSEYLTNIFADLITSIEEYEKAEKKREERMKTEKWCFSENYMNKDHGKYAIKRKIILLRQELMKYAKSLDG